MRIDVVFAGLGGQGLMTMGQILAVAAMNEGKHVSWLPTYSPEVRGGWANCTVVISDHSIGSPIVGQPLALVALERTAIARHAHTVKPEGLIVVNSSLVPEPVQRNDVRVFRIPAHELAAHLGNERVANSIMLGAYVAATGVVTVEKLAHAIGTQLAERPDLAEINIRALQEGVALVASQPSEVR
ncbi:MAG: 2-oxoacid:acceptor oxidoreductase family protein [Candidatus Zipacnadales bacterium]